MSGTYLAVGSAILLTWSDESRKAARCSDSATAMEAAKLLNKARYLNDVKRQYTAAARLIARVEGLPGFEWIETGDALLAEPAGYAARVRELEAEGLTTSDAQGVADAEFRTAEVQS